jgi:hypothetical protein
MNKRFISIFTAAFIFLTSFSAYALEWHQDAMGWKLLDKKKNKITSQWYYQDGNQYYFNSDGYMSVGWTQIGDNWYYFSEKGVLAINTWVDDTYVDYSGKMLTNTTTPDGYYVGADGRWVQSNNTGTSTSSNSANAYAAAAVTTGAGSTGSTLAMYNYGSGYTAIKPVEIKYMRAHMTKDGGISPNIYFINSSGKIINCIVFTVTPYDTAHNVATCDITGNSTVEKAVMGPFYPDNPALLGKYILTDKGTVVQTSIVTVTDYSKTFDNCAVLDHIWYSKSIATYGIVGIKIQYADGSWEVVNPSSVIKLSY